MTSVDTTGFAGVAAATVSAAASTFSFPKPQSEFGVGPVLKSEIEVLWRMVFIALPVNAGFICNSRAAAPTVMGEAPLVALCLPYQPPPSWIKLNRKVSQ